jgi:hypothetical protein
VIGAGGGEVARDEIRSGRLLRVAPRGDRPFAPADADQARGAHESRHALATDRDLLHDEILVDAWYAVRPT